MTALPSLFQALAEYAGVAAQGSRFSLAQLDLQGLWRDTTEFVSENFFLVLAVGAVVVLMMAIFSARTR